MYTGGATSCRESTMKEMEELLKARIAKLKRDYERRGKVELLMRIKELRALLQYIRKRYGNIQHG
jgi:hypothetical protein